MSRNDCGDVVSVPHAGRVDDAGNAVEAGLVEVGDRQVERRLVEQLGQHLLVELGVDLAAAQRHLGDRADARARRDADAAQRRDHATAGRLGQVEARGLRREQVGDVAGDQRAGGGHADPDRLCHLRIAAEVFSPSAVCASSQITIVYAPEILPALRTNHW